MRRRLSVPARRRRPIRRDAATFGIGDAELGAWMARRFGGAPPGETGAVSPVQDSLSLALRLIDPIFAFARDLVNGRVAGFPDYKVAGMPDFEHNVEPNNFVVDDRVFKAFKDYVAAHNEGYKVSDAQLERSRDFVARQLRYDLTTAAYGSVKATQVLVFDDPQVSKAIESLPRARDLATAAMRGRNPASKSFE